MDISGPFRQIVSMVDIKASSIDANGSNPRRPRHRGQKPGPFPLLMDELGQYWFSREVSKDILRDLQRREYFNLFPGFSVRDHPRLKNPDGTPQQGVFASRRIMKNVFLSSYVANGVNMDMQDDARDDGSNYCLTTKQSNGSMEKLEAHEIFSFGSKMNHTIYPECKNVLKVQRRGPDNIEYAIFRASKIIKTDTDIMCNYFNHKEGKSHKGETFDQIWEYYDKC